MCAGIGGAHATRKSIPTTRANVFSTIAMFISESQLKEIIKSPQAVAIVGAGPAGITIAMELEALGIESLLLEAGGFEFPDEEANDPYRGEVTGRPYSLDASRLRYFGGTSNHWGGWCRPLDPEDFVKIDGRPLSGWPIDYNTAYEHLERAHELCEIGGRGYDVEQIPQIKAGTYLPLDPDSGFRSGMFRFSPPTRFGKRYRETIAGSRKIRCALNVNLLRVARADGNRSSLLVKLPSQREATIKARALVLSMGGIENARYLLASNMVAAQPFGSDWNGQCFMEHFGYSAGAVYTKTGYNYNVREINNRGVAERVKMLITPSAKQLEEGGLNMFMAIRSRSREDELIKKDYAANKSLSRLSDQGLMHYFICTAGTSPNRMSHVALSDDKDIHGVNRIKLNWHVPDDDFRQIGRFAELFGYYIGYKGLGRLKRRKRHVIPKPGEALSTGMHHMGTTRMAESEATGVVDTDCRVFNSDDVFIAGSSVFPTAGYSNPTLTIVALAVRLAKHLRKIV